MVASVLRSQESKHAEKHHAREPGKPQLQFRHVRLRGVGQRRSSDEPAPNKEDLPSDERIRALTKIEDCADAEFYIIEQTGNRIKGTARIQRRLGYAKSRDAHEVISEI